MLFIKLFTYRFGSNYAVDHKTHTKSGKRVREKEVYEIEMLVSFFRTSETLYNY